MDNETREMFQTLINGQKEMAQRLDSLEQGQQAMATDVSTLKTDVSTLKTDVKRIDKVAAATNKTVTKTAKQVDILYGWVDDVDRKGKDAREILEHMPFVK